MVTDIEVRVYELIHPFAVNYIFSNKKVLLTLETERDSDLGIDELEAEDLMDEFFKEFDVDRSNFEISNYYPNVPFSWNFFKTMEPLPVPNFTIGMLIEPAKAGRWLYD